MENGKRIKKQTFNLFLSRAAQGNSFSEAISKALNSYQIRPYNILKLNPAKILEIYSHLCSKFYESNQASQFDSWYENQLRVFIWVLVVYTHLEGKKIELMDTADWQYFSCLFNGKNPDIIEFQAMCLVKRKKSKKWSFQEIQILTEIISEKMEKNKWNEIAKTLFTVSQKKYFRTPKQCREQWINHLDPSKIRSEWTTFEDYEMILTILRLGKKWSLVAKQLGNKRTEHMVKNRFKSLVNGESKRIDYEEKEDIVVMKIKQRLESMAAIKKYNQKKINEVKKKQKSDLESALERKTKIEEKIFFSQSDVKKQESAQGGVQVIEELENEQCEENGKNQIEVYKAEGCWVWQRQEMENLELNDLLLEKQLYQEEPEEYNDFFAPLNSVCFRFDF